MKKGMTTSILALSDSYSTKSSSIKALCAFMLKVQILHRIMLEQLKEQARNTDTPEQRQQDDKAESRR